MGICYLIFGILITAIGALPLGAVNIAVINTTIRENTKKAFTISMAAGIGEVLLVLFALYYSMEISFFIEKNQWIHILIILLFLGIGIYFLSKKNNPIQRSGVTSVKISKLLTGFSLAFFNPPVIIYWIIAISLTNKYLFQLTSETSLLVLFVFFIGVYIGKIGILYLYSKWGNKMIQKQSGSKTKLFHIIGVALILLSVFQGVKFLT